MLEKLISTLVTTIAVISVLHIVSGRKPNFKDYNLYITFFIMAIFTMFNFYYIQNLIRLLMSSLIIFIGNYIIFKDEIRKNLCSTIIAQLIVVVSEISYAIIMMALIKPIGGEDFINSFFGSIFPNLIMSVTMTMISASKISRNIYQKMIQISYKIEITKLIILLILLIVPINALVFLVYAGSSMLSMMITNIIFLMIYLIISYFSLNEKNENIKYKEENKALMKNLSEYEKLLSYQKTNNHENKNQLLVIRSMINKNNKRVLNYLDEIIKEKRKDDKILYTYAKIIPEGGLQGLVYQKMLKAKECGVNLDLEISKKISEINFDNISSKTNYDVCRIVGIILDNAIDEANKLTDKEVALIMYLEKNEFIIEVSNKCVDIPDLSLIDNKGYTTKSSGHGYGLSLLKEIIISNDDITNEKSINKDIFTQIIKVKL